MELLKQEWTINNLDIFDSNNEFFNFDKEYNGQKTYHKSKIVLLLSKWVSEKFNDCYGVHSHQFSYICNRIAYYKFIQNYETFCNRHLFPRYIIIIL